MGRTKASARKDAEASAKAGTQGEHALYDIQTRGDYLLADGQ